LRKQFNIYYAAFYDENKIFSELGDCWSYSPKFYPPTSCIVYTLILFCINTYLYLPILKFSTCFGFQTAQDFIDQNLSIRFYFATSLIATMPLCEHLWKTSMAASKNLLLHLKIYLRLSKNCEFNDKIFTDCIIKVFQL